MNIERTPETDFIVEQVLINRGTILTCFAQVEWWLGKFLVEAHGHPEYADQDLSFSINVEKRIRLMRQLLAAPGPFHEYQDRMEAVLDRLEERVEVRNFMAHAVLISSPHPEHLMVFRFRMFKAFKGGEEFEGKIDFTLAQLQEETAEISSIALEFIKIVREISERYHLDVFYPQFDDEAKPE